MKPNDDASQSNQSAFSSGTAKAAPWTKPASDSNLGEANNVSRPAASLDWADMESDDDDIDDDIVEAETSITISRDEVIDTSPYIEPMNEPMNWRQSQPMPRNRFDEGGPSNVSDFRSILYRLYISQILHQFNILLLSYIIIEFAFCYICYVNVILTLH